MATPLLQLTLALAPAIIASMVIKHVTLPWEKEKRPSERAELLNLLARDVKRVKLIMARNIAAVNTGKACAIVPLQLSNWKRVKSDKRLKKYADEKIFKMMIHQFNEWEMLRYSA